jgi:trigger factor
MKIELTDLSPVKKSLAVEADVEEVSKETAAVLRRFTSQVRLPGFRQGKAPVDIVRKRFAKEIEDDVRERLISRLWREATSEKGLVPLAIRYSTTQARTGHAVPVQDDVQCCRSSR